MNHKDSNNSGKNTLMIFIAGLAGGYIMSMLLPEKMKKKPLKFAQQKASDFRDFLTDPQEQQRIRDLFKERTDEAVSMYREARESLVSNLSDLKQSWDSIDKDKYLETVQETIDELREKQNFPVRQLSKLKQFFDEDYERLSNDRNSKDK